jgi:hypothetical protein
MRRKRLTYRGQAYTDPMQAKLQQYEDALEDGELYDKDFLLFVFGISYDKIPCNSCAYNCKKQICRNFRSGDFKDVVCVQGIKKYYDKQKNKDNSTGVQKC